MLHFLDKYFHSFDLVTYFFIGSRHLLRHGVNVHITRCLNSGIIKECHDTTRSLCAGTRGSTRHFQRGVDPVANIDTTVVMTKDESLMSDSLGSANARRAAARGRVFNTPHLRGSDLCVPLPAS
jgi:hypothetical protein